tara:strand:- start:234 stop:665 length:432 start_codon:yes stop_codon:yes gene_type:complete
MAAINTDISQKIDITIKAEDSLSLVLNITDSTGAAFNLSEYYVFFDIYGTTSDDTLIAASNLTARNTELSGDDLTQSDYFNIVSGYTLDKPAAVVVTDATGKIELTLTSDETSLTPGSYKYKVKLKKGTTIKTWMHGKFKVNE